MDVHRWFINDDIFDLIIAKELIVALAGPSSWLTLGWSVHVGLDKSIFTSASLIGDILLIECRMLVLTSGEALRLFLMW